MQEPSVWVLADDRAGNVSQAQGVAEALGWPFQVKHIPYTATAGLPNILRGRSLIGVERSARAGLAPPWPDVVIAAGRRTAPVARWIKARSGGVAYLCQIMWPGAAGIDDFDLIAVPTHDDLPGIRPNVLRITGAPHRVTDGRLAVERAKWSDRLGSLRSPRIALIVGGSTKNRTFTPAMARELGRLAAGVAERSGGSLLITTSRRTGAEATQALMAAVPNASEAFLWGTTAGENPYFAYLAMADAVIVTGDSVSMVSEACATTVPVYIYGPEGLVAPKHARLHRHLYGLGMAEPLGETFSRWSHPPLNAANDIAGLIRLSLTERT